MQPLNQKIINAFLKKDPGPKKVLRLTKGKEWPDDEETRSESALSANNGKSIKYHHPKLSLS